MKSNVWAGLFILVLAGLANAEQWDVPIEVGERSFTIETERLRATFKDGMIVGLTNRLTGETHACPDLEEYGMPRGMGHMRGGVDEMERLHTPWRLSSMQLASPEDIHEQPADRGYAVYYHPTKDAGFETRPIDNGIEATWLGLTNGEAVFPEDELTIRAWVDEDTGHVAFKSIARSTEEGVFGVQTPLTNLADYHRFYVPSFSGVMLDKHMQTGLNTFQGLNNFLEARVLGIEGENGSIGLWAQDEAFHNHYLFHYWSGRGFSAAFKHHTLMPFEEHTSIESPVLYLDGFEGGWVDAMTPYRDWYHDAFAEEMEMRANPEWADSIRVIVDAFDPGDETMYAQLAEMLDPATVMFHEWNARAPAFDTELPDWTPSEGYPEQVAGLREQGFRTMAYVNTYCVNYNSPVFKEDDIAAFGLTRKMNIADYSNRRLDEDQESQWEHFDDGELLYQDPLAPEWRDYHADNMVAWNEETGTCANYEDVLGTARDFGNGVIDGLFAGQGGAEQTRELLRRNPDVPMASEYGPENIAFGIHWPLTYLTVWGSTEQRLFWTERTRPIAAYIHGVRPWVPILRTQDDIRRHWVMAWSDAYGGLAQLQGTTLDLSATQGALALLNHRAELFSSRQLEPYFESGPHEDDLVCMYRDAEGALYRYHATSTLQEMVGPEGEPLYQRVRGKHSLETPLAIHGWPAHGEGQVFGLNPRSYYALMSSEDKPETDVHVSELPSGIMVRRYYEGDQAAVLALKSMDESAPTEGVVELSLTAPVEGIILNDELHEAPAWDEQEGRSARERYETEFPAYFVFLTEDAPHTGHGPVEREEETGVHLTPDTGLSIGVDFTITARRQWDVPNAGGTGAPGPETFRQLSDLEQVTLDYLVEVPDADTSVILYLKSAQNVHGNGVIARAYVNGRMVRAYDFGAIANPDWEEGMDPGERDLWPERNVHMWKIPLGGLAGQTALISIGTDYKKSTNANNFWWSKPILVTDGEQTEKYVAVTDDGEIPEEEFRVLDADFMLEEGHSRDAPSGF